MALKTLINLGFEPEDAIRLVYTKVYGWRVTEEAPTSDTSEGEGE